MRVLMLHNHYQQASGEEGCFFAEAEMLERHGHEVITYQLHNDDIPKFGRAELAAATIWNRKAYRDVERLIAATAPAIMHCHNTFPLISPAVYYAARRSAVPVVQTLHNYRLLCLAGTLFRDGAPCEDCLGRTVPWPGVAHKCYRGSRLYSLGVAAMQSIHRGLDTWGRQVDLFLAVSQFVQRKFIENGLPPQRIRIKPNFLMNDPGMGTGQGGYAVCVGRLSPEKGLRTLLAAWDGAQIPVPLKIVGDGPQTSLGNIAPNAAVEFVGRRSSQEVFRLMQAAQFLVAPSEWYEPGPRTIIEAYACGTPVIASDTGSFSELVEDGRTGFKYAPGNASDLREKIALLLHDSNRMQAMRRAARREFLAKYTQERNYRELTGAYAELRGV
jgi:glycosyltransferase involved in cell wall biosynthesis